MLDRNGPTPLPTDENKNRFQARNHLFMYAQGPLNSEHFSYTNICLHSHITIHTSVSSTAYIRWEPTPKLVMQIGCNLEWGQLWVQAASTCCVHERRGSEPWEQAAQL